MAPGVDILIATPGRLTDLVREGEINLSETRWLVLDEADRMLDMGFINDVKRIAKATHRDRQTALFSATMPDEIEQLARGIMKDPVHVEVAPQGTTAAEIKQGVVMARTKQKRQVLSAMLADPAMSSVIVFSRTKHGADRVVRDLERDGFNAAVIHGNKSQNARQKALNGFRDGSVRILVATDIAARGIDVPGISHVVNFDLPDEAESYVHRIGRTGRNGADGIAITLCDPSENSKLRAVERIIRMKLPVTADHTGQPDPHATRSRAQRTQRRAGERSRRAIATATRPRGDQKPREGFGKKSFGGKPGGGERKPFNGKRRWFRRSDASRRRERPDQQAGPTIVDFGPIANEQADAIRAAEAIASAALLRFEDSFMAGIAALAIGYVLSQFYRSFMAVLTPVLTGELGMTKVELSAASGAWFVTFALMQFAVGVSLDRFGPRRTASMLLAVGGGGGRIPVFRRDGAVDGDRGDGAYRHRLRAGADGRRCSSSRAAIRRRVSRCWRRGRSPSARPATSSAHRRSPTRQKRSAGGR